MRFSHYGIHYAHDRPSLEVAENEILSAHGTVNLRCNTLRKAVPFRSILILKYGRCTNETDQTVAATPSMSQLMAVKRVAKPVATGNPLAKEVERVHYANLRRNLERRLQLAKEQGNQALIRLLEAEFNQLA